ncbi:hypothetical protein NPIL_479551, partial [Nephila pilipes]
MTPGTDSTPRNPKTESGSSFGGSAKRVFPI